MNLYICSFLCLSKNEYMSSLLHITMERPQRMQNLQNKFVIFFAQSICACVCVRESTDILHNINKSLYTHYVHFVLCSFFLQKYLP